MNILKEYTLDYVWRNKKSSITIMIAIFIATTLLSALIGIFYNMYADEIRLTIMEKGNWHAELFDNTSGNMLKYVTGHPNVETVMIKGTWETAKIDDPRRPYIIMRGLTKNYWEDMPEQGMIIEGSIPQSKNELAISKQYFEYHPDLQIGDILHIPVGSRVLNGELLESRSIWKNGEVFVPVEERSYTVVGKLDVTTNSITPAYLAYGYLDEAVIGPDDQLTVYMRFRNMRKAYEDIVEIAKSVGFKPDEYGNYAVRTNNSLLSKHFIFSKEEVKDLELWRFSLPLMSTVIALIAAGVFVFIINNAFAMSANARLRQLGIMQSIGASPRQIGRSVVFESLILSVMPIPAGIFTGWLLVYSMFAYINSYINSMNNLRDYNSEIVFALGLPAVLSCFFLGLLTVWLSAVIPTRKITKLSPIDAIRQGGDLKVKKLKKHRLIEKLFGIAGELARNALDAQRKSYRTAMISLTLSFTLLSGFLNLMAIAEAGNKLFYDDIYESERDIMLDIKDGNLMALEVEEKIRSIDGLKSVLFACKAPISLWLEESMESEELSSIGGLSRIAGSGKYPVHEDNGSFKIQTYLLTLDDESFNAYCRRIGADAELFYDPEMPRVIAVNEVRDDINSNRRNDIRIPFLKLSIGDKLSCEEKIYQEVKGGYAFQTEVGFLTDQMPPIGMRYGGFQLVQIIPKSVYLDIVGHFEEAQTMRAHFISVPLAAQSEEMIQPVEDKLKDMCDRWYGSGDYSIWNITQEYKKEEKGRQLTKIIMICIAGFIALIGISNIFSTVSGTLQQRRKEFAMLRSVGLSPGRLRRMLLLEALFFGFMPILASIPLNIIVIGIFLKINMIYVTEFIPFVPVMPITVFGAAIILSLVLAYLLCSRRLRDDIIVDILKDEAL